LYITGYFTDLYARRFRGFILINNYHGRKRTASLTKIGLRVNIEIEKVIHLRLGAKMKGVA
jgi:hypothetical protein